MSDIKGGRLANRLKGFAEGLSRARRPFEVPPLARNSNGSSRPTIRDDVDRDEKGLSAPQIPKVVPGDRTSF